MQLQTGLFSNVNTELTVQRAAEKRSFTEAPVSLANPEAWLFDALGAERSDAGVRVTELGAFAVSTFHACVDLVSSALAALPCHVYEKGMRNGRIVRNIAHDHPTYDLINIEPNPDMSSFTFRKVLAVSFLVFGNGYAEIFRDGANRITSIWPCNPYSTFPFILQQNTTLPAEAWRPFPVTLKAGTMAFKTVGLQDDPNQAGHERIICPEDMIHIPGLSFTGRLGESLVGLARHTIGKALAMGKYGSRYFANFASPSGILEVPSTDATAREKARESWIKRQSADGAHSIAVMPQGSKFTAISNSPEQSQALQAQQFVRIEMAGLFHVPPTMIGDVDKGKSNAEQLGQEFISYCLNPWLEIERQEFKRKLFPNPDFVGVGRRPQKNNFFVDFDLHRLLRPTAADRQSYYATGFSTGSLSPNDIREMEALNPREDEAGDAYYVQVNMARADKPAADANSADPVAGDNNPDQEANSLVPVYSRMFRDAFGRVISRDKADSKVFHRTFSPVLYAVADMICQQEDPEFRFGQNVPADVVKFVDDYIGGMLKRSASWTSENADLVSAEELGRAIGAVKTSVTHSLSVNPKQ